MSRYRKITTICCAAVFALGLAACGGGDDGISVADRDAAVAAEQAKTEALQMQIDALRAQLELEDDGNVGDSVAALQAEVTRLEGLVDAAEQAKEAEDMKAMTATGEKLKMAIDAAIDDGENNAVMAGVASGSATLGTKLSVTVVGTSEAVELKAGEDGMSYSLMNAMGKVTHEAMVYSDRGMPTMEKFSDEYGSSTDPTYDGDKMQLTGWTAADPKIGGSGFPTEGMTTYPQKDGATELSMSGTYDGAMGTYFCSGDACSARHTSVGIVLEGGWRFVHAKDAMVSRPDPSFLYYGWWVSKDATSGEPAATGVFANAMNGTMSTGVSDSSTFGDGSATYMGSAAGKYAMEDKKAGTAEGGHFTADVTLTAKFGGGPGAGLSGTVDGFMAGDETKPWSIALSEKGWNNAGNGVDATDGTTVWSINGNKATKSGSWSATMYDMATTGAEDDNSNVPTDVIGTFEAMFGDSGSMIGAFGAKKSN